MKSTSRLLLAPLLLATAGISPAASILIDFGRSGAGYTTPSTPEATWNNVNSLTVSTTTPLTGGALLDSTGADSGVTLNFTGVNGAVGVSNIANYTTPVEGIPLSASRDYITLNDGRGQSDGAAAQFPATATFQLNGLVANGVYDLTFFAALPGPTARPQTGWTVTGATSDTASLYAPNNTSTDTARVQADADGRIEIVWNNGTDFTGVSLDGDTAVWNTLEINFIPEPSSALLAGSALLGGCFLRRRRA